MQKQTHNRKRKMKERRKTCKRKVHLQRKKEKATTKLKLLTLLHFDIHIRPLHILHILHIHHILHIDRHTIFGKAAKISEPGPNKSATSAEMKKTSLNRYLFPSKLQKENTKNQQRKTNGTGTNKAATTWLFT